MRDRQLLRTNTSTASVVGLVPESLLTTSTTTTNNDSNSPAIPSSSCGGIDIASGLAYLVIPSDNNTNNNDDNDDNKMSGNAATTGQTKLHIWRHEMYTLAEDLISHDSNAAIQLTHPASFQTTDTTTDIRHERLLALVPVSTSDGTAPVVSSSSSLLVPPGSMSLYWCSPSGILCYWNDLSTLRSSSSSTGSCDVCIPIPLCKETNERVTVITHTHNHSGGSNTIGGGGNSGGGGVLIIGTSSNRTFVIRKNTRPLELTVHLLSSRDAKRNAMNGNDRQERGLDAADSGGGGLMGGIYSRLFTPGKKRSNPLPPTPTPTNEPIPTSNDNDDTMDDANTTNGVVGIFTLQHTAGSSGSSEYRMSPINKARKLLHPSNVPMDYATTTASGETTASSTSSIYTVCHGGTIDTWTTSPTATNGSGGTSNGDSICLGRHLHTVSLTAAMTKILQNDTTIRWDKSETLSSVQVLDCTLDTMASSTTISTSASNTGGGGLDSQQTQSPHPNNNHHTMSSIICCLKLIFSTTGTDTTNGRIYLVRCPINPQDGSVTVGMSLWLSRYSSDAIMMGEQPQQQQTSSRGVGGALQCAGIMTRTEKYNDGAGVMGDGNYTTTVYSVFQQGPSSGHDSTLSLPVTISTARFFIDGKNTPTDNIEEQQQRWAADGKIQNYDVDLPSDVIPTIVRGAIASDSTTDGCILIGSTGCVTTTCVSFPTDTIITTTSATNNDTIAAATIVSSTERMEMAEVLASHILSTFRLYHRQREQRRQQQNYPYNQPQQQQQQQRQPFSPTVTRHGELDSSLPQSIHAADSDMLSDAVSIASSYLVNERYNATEKVRRATKGLNDGNDDQTNNNINSNKKTINVKCSSLTYGAASARLLLRDKVDAHETYLNFLIRAGIYRKVGLRGRMVLRDHGEMLHAVGGLYEAWQGELEHIRGSGGGNRRRSQGNDSLGSNTSELYTMEGDDRDRDIAIIQKGLIGIEEAVTDFPNKFRALQREVLLLDATTGDESVGVTANTGCSVWAIYQVCNLSCKSMEYALGYREARSEIIYDLASSPPNRRGWGSSNHEGRGINTGTGGGCYPWSSNHDILATIEDNMVALQALLDDTARCDIVRQMPSEELIRQMACTLLDGYRDITPSRRDEGRYDRAKRLAISLVQRISPALPPNLDAEGEGEGDREEDALEDLAFQLSLDHGHFEGVLAICHDRYDRPTTAHQQRSSPYDIGIMMLQSNNNVDASGGQEDDNKYDGLYTLPDYTTGLSFPKFVLRWYTDRKMASRVLELGSNCPNILSECMEEDSRLADLRWLQHLRTGSYDMASQCLTGLVSGGIVPLGGEGKGGGGVPPSMEGRQLVLSLAKLSNLLKKNNSNGGMVDKNLQLCKAQEILAGMMDKPQEALKTAMLANDLILLVLKLTDTLEDAQDISRVCLAGLSVVEVINLDDGASASNITDLSSGNSTNNYSKSAEAGKIWSKSIDSDAETWANMIQYWNEMADDERIMMVHNTVFFHLARDYYETLDDGNSVDTVGFKNAKVREEALALLTLSEGIEEILENVLDFSDLST